MWHLLFLIFVIVLPFNFALNPTHGIDLPIVRLLVPIIFLILIFDSFLKRKLQIDLRFRFFAFILFLLLIFLSLSWALEPSFGTRKVLFLFSLAPLYFISFIATKSRQSRQKILRFLVWSGFAVALFAILQFFLQFILGINDALAFIKWYTPFFLGNSFSSLVFTFPSWLVNISGTTVLRAFGSFPDPHLFSLYINMLVPLSLLIYSTTKKKFYLVTTFIMISASLLSFSRASYLSILGGFLFFLSTKNVFLLIKKHFSLVFFTTLITIAFLITPNTFTNRFFSSFNIKEGSNTGRIEMWNVAIGIIKEKPLSGVGIGNFSYYVNSKSNTRNSIYAHNLFLDFGSETGIINMLMLTIIIFSPIIAFYQKPSPLKLAIATTFVIFFIHSIFETPFFSVRVFSLFCVLLAFNDHA